MTPRSSLGVWRLLVGACAVLLIIVASAPAARADAAGPTDYRSEILRIDPPVSSLSLEMIGGDAFLQMVQLAPVEIEVLGYRNEPYLRFDADGTVVENRRSPSAWLNEERYGTDDTLPSFVDHEAPPQWRVVANDGTYAWHDHRTHWMNPNRPPGAEGGDQVLEAVVPLLVDGQRVSVTVGSWLLDDPSPLPAIAGAAVGLAVAGLAVVGSRLRFAALAAVVAAAAFVVGAVAWRSVPAETGPPQPLWLLPLVALGSMLLVMLVRNRLATTVYLDGLAVVCGVALMWWSVSRSSALVRALIPSDMPGWVDRTVIASAATVGLVVLGRGIYGLMRPERLIDPS